MSEPPGRADAQTGESWPADLTITITDAGPDDLRSLRSWLVQEDELRGGVVLVPQSPAPGTLGAGLEALSVSLSGGGAISVLVAGTMSWIRQRYGQRRSGGAIVRLRRADGACFEISADVLGTWSPAEFAARIRQLAEALDSGSAAPGPDSRTP
jgi:hypothetical protein